MATEQLERNQIWMERLQKDMFRRIIYFEDHFKLSKKILNENIYLFEQKNNVLQAFNEFSENYPTFIKEMETRAKFNYYLESLFNLISSEVRKENQRRVKFINFCSQAIPVQVNSYIYNFWIHYDFDLYLIGAG